MGRLESDPRTSARGGYDWGHHLKNLGFRVLEVKEEQRFQRIVTERAGGASLIIAPRAMHFDEKASILDAVASASDSNFDQVALMVPKQCAALLETSILESHGIGLITWDPRLGVSEVLRPGTRERGSRPLGEAAIQELVKRVSRLEAIVAQLVSERTKSSHHSLPNPVMGGDTIIHFDAPASDTADFLKDNPWITILSQRRTGS